MLGELMVGTAAEGQAAAISDLTLAVFADAGWYEPNYSVGAPRCYYEPSWCAASPSTGAAASGGRGGRERDAFLWGRDRGCSFVSSRCDAPSWRAEGYWCAADPRDTSLSLADQRSAIDAEGCTLGRMAVGHCSLREHDTALPAQFRYFAGEELARLGGHAMEDYCPVSLMSPNGHQPN